MKRWSKDEDAKLREGVRLMSAPQKDFNWKAVAELHLGLGRLVALGLEHVARDGDLRDRAAKDEDGEGGDHERGLQDGQRLLPLRLGAVGAMLRRDAARGFAVRPPPRVDVARRHQKNPTLWI